MTIESKISKNLYKGNGTTTIFPFTFKVWEDTQLLVTVEKKGEKAQAITPNKIVLTENGGEVTLYLDSETKSAYTDEYKIALTRNMPFLQETDYINGTRVNTEVFENDLDVATAERQELLEKLARSLILPPTSEITPEEAMQDFIIRYEDFLKKYADFFIAYGNIFCQSIKQFITEDNVLEYELGTDFIDPDANNLLLVADNIVQQPDVAYTIIEPNKIRFFENQGAGKKVWGISSIPFSNPDIRAIVEKAIAKIKAEGEIQKEIVATEGDTQVAILEVEGAKWANLSQAWAESPTPPDPKDPNSKSAKEWAKIASDTVPLASYSIAGKVQISKETLSVTDTGLLSINSNIIDKINNNSQATNVNSQAILQNSQKIESNLQAITNLQNNKIDKSAISSDLNLTTETNVASSKAVNDLFKLIKGENVPDYPDISGGGGSVKEIARRYKTEKDGAWTFDVIPYKPVHITAKISVTHANSACYLRLMNGADTTTASNVDAYNYGGYVAKANGYLSVYDMVIIPTSSSLTLKTYNINTFNDDEYIIAYQ